MWQLLSGHWIEPCTLVCPISQCHLARLSPSLSDVAANIIFDYISPLQVSGQVSQPLFTYDTIRRDSYTRLDSDASSLAHSLSPNHQVSQKPSWHISWNFEVKTWFDVGGGWGIGPGHPAPTHFIKATLNLLVLSPNEKKCVKEKKRSFIFILFWGEKTEQTVLVEFQSSI